MCNEKINVLCIANNRYVEPLKVFILSLFTSNDSDIDLYTVYTDVDDNTINLLKEYCSIWEGKKLIAIKGELPKDERLRYSETFPKEIYFKLLCADILPKSISKILILDLDMVINKPLDKLYATDLSGKPLAACKDIYGYVYGEAQRNLIRLGIDSVGEYFNAGMLLVNLDYFREAECGVKLINYAIENANILKWYEQDALNCFFLNDDISLNWHEYNCAPIMYVMKESEVAQGIINTVYQEEASTMSDFTGYADYTLAICDNATIIHYIGETKPWNKNRIPSNTFNIFDRYYNEYEKMVKTIWQEKEY